MNNNTEIKEAPVQKELTRQQKRFKERIENEARETHQQIAEKFLNFFTLSDDPEGELVKEKMKQCNAQWIVYCKRKGLNVEVHNAMDQFMNSLINDYRDSKK